MTKIWFILALLISLLACSLPSENQVIEITCRDGRVVSLPYTGRTDYDRMGLEACGKITIPSDFPDDLISSEERERLENNTLSSPACQGIIDTYAIIEGDIVTKRYFKEGGDLEVFTYLGIKTPDDCIFYFVKKSSAPGLTRRWNEHISETIGDHILIKGFVRGKYALGGGNQILQFYEIHPAK